MARTLKETFVLLQEVLKDLHALNESDRSGEELIFPHYYTPDQRLSDYIDRLQEKVKVKNRSKIYHIEIGQLMEQIAFLCFKSLVGVSELKSFQSPGPQYDLIVIGEGAEWEYLYTYLCKDNIPKDFIVEVKATKQKVNDQQFARLCSLLQLNLCKTSGLGIFFTINGATGFPDSSTRKRQRALRDARLRQVMFMASCKKPILVFDIRDIISLKKPGKLVELIKKKFRDIEQLTGIDIASEIDEPTEVDLPKHLMELYQTQIIRDLE